MKPANRYILMSVFYKKDQWHRLLALINKDIYGDPWFQSRLVFVLCFLNFHRGDNIQLLFKLSPLADIDTSEKIDAVIRNYLLENPSPGTEVKLPITSCFSDIPVNSIRYNIFDQNCLYAGRLQACQLVISKIISVFFSNRSFDSCAMFTIVAKIQEAIVGGLTLESQERKETCRRLIQLLQDDQTKDNFEQFADEVDDQDLNNQVDFFLGKSMADYLSDLARLSRNLYEFSNYRLDCYEAIISVVKSHFPNVEASLYVDGLRSIMSENWTTKFAVGST